MHERRGVERLPGRLAGQPGGGQPPEVAVDQRQEPGGRPGLAAVHGVEHLGHFAHRPAPPRPCDPRPTGAGPDASHQHNGRRATRARASGRLGPRPSAGRTADGARRGTRRPMGGYRGWGGHGPLIRAYVRPRRRPRAGSAPAPHASSAGRPPHGPGDFPRARGRAGSGHRPRTTPPAGGSDPALAGPRRHPGAARGSRAGAAAGKAARSKQRALVRHAEVDWPEVTPGAVTGACNIQINLICGVRVGMPMPIDRRG